MHRKGLSSRLRWEAGWPCVPAGGGTPPGRGGVESPRRRAGPPPPQAPPGCYLVVPYRFPGRAAFSEVADRAMCVGAWWPLLDALDALGVLVALVGLVRGLGGAAPAGASAANTGPAMSMVARSEVTIPFIGLVPPARSYTSITLAVTQRAYRPLPREQAPCRGGRSSEGRGGITPGAKTAVAFGHRARHLATGRAAELRSGYANRSGHVDPPSARSAAGAAAAPELGGGR